MDIGKGREQDTQALLNFYLAHLITNLAPRLNSPLIKQILTHKGQQTLIL